MKEDDLIRDLVRLRGRDRVPEESLNRMSSGELHRRPEALVLAIVRGFAEFKTNGYSDADTYREIEGRRAEAYGEEPLPADLNLETYTCYRLRLEYPGEAALHEPIFAMQAVHRVQKYLTDQYGDGGTPVTIRGMPRAHLLLIVYSVIVAVVQGIGFAFVASVHFRNHNTPQAAASALLVAVAAGVALGALGYAGRAAWGRVAIRAALALEIVVPWVIIAVHAEGINRYGFTRVHGVNTLVAAMFLAYAYDLWQGRKPVTG